MELVLYHNAAAGDTFLGGKSSSASFFLSGIEFYPPAGKIYFSFQGGRSHDDLIWVFWHGAIPSDTQTGMAKHPFFAKQQKVQAGT